MAPRAQHTLCARGGATARAAAGGSRAATAALVVVVVLLLLTALPLHYQLLLLLLRGVIEWVGISGARGRKRGAVSAATSERGPQTHAAPLPTW